MDALKCLCVRACHFIIWVIELFEPVLHINLLNGSKKERKEAELAGRKAQLVKIWARATTITAAEHDLTNFLYAHHSYVSPNYVLAHDNVALHSFTKDLVIFAVSDPQVTKATVSSSASTQYFRYEQPLAKSVLSSGTAHSPQPSFFCSYQLNTCPLWLRRLATQRQRGGPSPSST